MRLPDQIEYNIGTKHMPNVREALELILPILPSHVPMPNITPNTKNVVSTLHHLSYALCDSFTIPPPPDCDLYDLTDGWYIQHCDSFEEFFGDCLSDMIVGLSGEQLAEQILIPIVENVDLHLEPNQIITDVPFYIRYKIEETLQNQLKNLICACISAFDEIIERYDVNYDVDADENDELEHEMQSLSEMFSQFSDYVAYAMYYILTQV